MKSLPNLLIDTVQALETASRDDTVWASSLSLCREIGISDVNIGEFRKGEFMPTWARSTMTDHPEYNDFMEHQLYLADPLLHARQTGKLLAPAFHDVKNLEPVPGLEDSSNKLAQLKEYVGFERVFTFSSPGRLRDMERLVVFGTDKDHSRGLAEYGLQGVGTVASLIGEYVAPATRNDPTGNFADLYQFLSVKEHDALCYLAAGLTNTEIAYKMNIAEVTVRHHIKNARLKMGARTREEALSLAIVRRQLRL